MSNKSIYREEIINSLKPLFQRARSEGLWFHSAYQDLWFSPDELMREQSTGHFVWGPENWTLRHPSEKRKSIERDISQKMAELGRLNDRI